MRTRSDAIIVAFFACALGCKSGKARDCQNVLDVLLEESHATATFAASRGEGGGLQYVRALTTLQQRVDATHVSDPGVETLLRAFGDAIEQERRYTDAEAHGQLPPAAHMFGAAHSLGDAARQLIGTCEATWSKKERDSLFRAVIGK